MMPTLRISQATSQGHGLGSLSGTSWPGGLLGVWAAIGPNAYRFAFQGQEKDDELHGSTGTAYAYKYRMHDVRIGRFLSIDPLVGKYAYNSPYAFSENRVVDGFELEGLEVVLPSPWEVFTYHVFSAVNRTRENPQSEEEVRVAARLGFSQTMRIQRAREVAGEVVRSRGINPHGATGNAVRHALGQAYATVAAGASAAKLLADAHEGDEKNLLVDNAQWVDQLRADGYVMIPREVVDQFVDLYNNQVGREIGMKHADEHPDGVDLEALQNEVFEAYNSGQLLEWEDRTKAMVRVTYSGEQTHRTQPKVEDSSKAQ